MDRVLVISPHPDDESIGCGGSIRRHVEEGAEVEIIFLTSGEAGGHRPSREETARLREEEASAACAILGVRSFDFWRLADGRLRDSPGVRNRLRERVLSLRANLLYVPHQLEQHPDHRAAFRIARSAVFSIRKREARPEVRTYEIWTPMPTMSHISDITDQLETKLRAIRAHRTQCSVMPFDEAFRGLARYRGEMHSWPGGPYAEVFGGLAPQRRKKRA